MRLFKLVPILGLLCLMSCLKNPDSDLAPNLSFFVVDNKMQDLTFNDYQYEINGKQYIPNQFLTDARTILTESNVNVKIIARSDNRIIHQANLEVNPNISNHYFVTNSTFNPIAYLVKDDYPAEDGNLKIKLVNILDSIDIDVYQVPTGFNCSSLVGTELKIISALSPLSESGYINFPSTDKVCVTNRNQLTVLEEISINDSESKTKVWTYILFSSPSSGSNYRGYGKPFTTSN